MAEEEAASLTRGGKPLLCSRCLAVLLFDLLVPSGKCFELSTTVRIVVSRIDDHVISYDSYIQLVYTYVYVCYCKMM